MPGLPGAFVLTFDSCQYGMPYRHRQLIVTNQPWMAFLSKDCPGNHEHIHVGSAEFPTHKVAAFATALVKHWATLFATFVKAPDRDRCVHCAHTAGKPQVDLVARVRADCSERFLGDCEGVVMISLLRPEIFIFISHLLRPRSRSRTSRQVVHWDDALRKTSTGASWTVWLFVTRLW